MHDDKQRGYRGALALLTALGLSSPVNAKPAPAAPAPAPAQKSPPQQAAPDHRSAADPSWVSQLPTVAAVQQAFRSADAADSAMRQVAAFETLVKFIEAMTGANRFQTEKMPPAAASRLIEYQGSPTSPRGTLASREQGLRNAETVAFQKATLDALLPKASADAYWNTAAGKKVKANDQRAAAEATARAQKADSDQRASAAAAADVARAKARLAPDLAAANKAKLDLTVLGIELGAALDLPPCQSNESSFAGMLGVGSGSSSQSCRSDSLAGMQDQVAQLKEKWTGDGGPAAVAGTTNSSVRLADAKCPDWVKNMGMCLAYVTLQSNLVVEVSLTVSKDKADKITAQLTKKYGPSNGKGDRTECTNNQTGMVVSRSTELRWTLPGLYVSYAPVGTETCGPGAITVQLASYHHRQGEAQTRKQQSEPQL